MQVQERRMHPQKEAAGLSPEQAALRLQAFVESTYYEEDWAHQSHIRLKLDHSLRVWEGVQHIAALEKMATETRRLAEIGAVYHDVGRFPQYRRYRTFQDSLSENHGRLGFVTLRTSDLLQGLPRTEARNVLRCVFMHNRPTIPPGLPRGLHAVLSLVRDADKLDIIGVISTHLVHHGGGDQVLTLGLTDDPRRYSPRIAQQVLHRSLVNYQDMVWVNDFKLLLCSWVFGLNYSATLDLIRQRGEVQELLDSLPQDGHIAELKEQVLTALKV
ncbi:MAG: HD domain-containing protein [Desulfovermiculus sp.]